jgi:hypothetical protein
VPRNPFQTPPGQGMGPEGSPGPSFTQPNARNELRISMYRDRYRYIYIYIYIYRYMIYVQYKYSYTYTNTRMHTTCLLRDLAPRPAPTASWIWAAFWKEWPGKPSWCNWRDQWKLSRDYTSFFC